MMLTTEKIQSFTQLRTWQNARGFAVTIYKLTEQFPSTERYGLTSQMRRSSVSVASNIAEGFSRSTAKDKINLYSMALGSLTETISHAYIASDLGYLKELELEQILNLAGDLRKMTNGLMKSAQGRNP
jgi:four helix bundle protein